ARGAVEDEMVAPGHEAEDAVVAIVAPHLAVEVVVVVGDGTIAVGEHIVARPTSDVDVDVAADALDEGVVARTEVGDDVPVAVVLNSIVAAPEVDVSRPRGAGFDANVHLAVHVDGVVLAASGNRELALLHVGVGVLDSHDALLLYY